MTSRPADHSRSSFVIAAGQEHGQEHQLPQGARGIIGDGRTAALVRVDGVIDWLCLPRFDSPSVFGALLDQGRGGVLATTPTRRPFESFQRYEPETNVLETTFRVAGEGEARLVDFMPWDDEAGAPRGLVFRRVDGLAGEVELDVVVDPRFDYGRRPARVDIEGHGLVCTGGPDERFALTAEGLRFEARAEGGVRATLRVRPGESRWLVLAWGAESAAPADSHRPAEVLEEARRGGRAWVRGLSYEGAHRDRVVRSALLLKLLVYAPTGAMVAAPTTSLPEWIGGTRNWDYRYSWTRDTAMAMRSMLRVGGRREARRFFDFVRETLARDPELRVMYTVDGREVPTETTLEHLRGYRDSAPVRIGNGAREQLQLDAAGTLFDCAAALQVAAGARDEGTGLTRDHYQRLRGAADDVRERWREPDHGIWEPRGPKRHNVHSKLMSWVALEGAAALAQSFGDEPARLRFHGEAREVKADVLRCGVAEGREHFTTAYGMEEVDASLLLVPIHGLVAPSDPRAVATVKRIREVLGDGDFLYRYHMHDGVGGSEGAFVLCGFWLAEALAVLGQVDAAERVFDAHAVRAANHLGLLAEEVDPRDNSGLGNFPQAFSHLGLIDAAVRIDRLGRSAGS